MVKNNSKGRKLEFDFEYCLTCDLRLLDGKSIMTKDILHEEFERCVIKAKSNNYVSSVETTVQHSDFESLERLIKGLLVELGKLKRRWTFRVQIKFFSLSFNSYW